MKGLVGGWPWQSVVGIEDVGSSVLGLNEVEETGVSVDGTG